MKINKLFKNIKYSIFILPIPFIVASCAKDEIIIEYQTIEPSWTNYERFSLSQPTAFEGKAQYNGKYDNKWLNFSANNSYIDHIAIIESVKDLEYHFENHYYFVSFSSPSPVSGKYKYWDSSFLSWDKQEELKSKYNEDFFKTKILVINAGWGNKWRMSIPKVQFSDKKLSKQNFYQKITTKNSFNSEWNQEIDSSLQKAHFYEFTKKDWFEE